MKPLLLNLLSSKELWLAIAIITTFMLIFLQGWVVYLKGRARANKTMGDNFILTFEIDNGLKFPYHPLSFHAHDQFMNALKNRLTRITLLKDTQVIRNYQPEEYFQAKDEVKRLARLM
jgi:hypothetical protein